MLDGIRAESTPMMTTTKIILAAIFATAGVGYFQLVGATDVDAARRSQTQWASKVVVSSAASDAAPLESASDAHR
jgi:hypothetical protein